MPARTTFLRTLTASAASLMLLAAPWSAPSVLAQQGAPADQQQPAAQPLSTEQLDQLVAPIALYPDNLLGQILTASTYPLEDVMAARWSAANPNVKGPQLEAAMQQQTWDPSVKALTAVPQVLAMMSDKLDWTQALGDAYLSQPDDIAAAVQRLRIKAEATGNLQASTQERVRRVPAPQPIIIDGRPQPDYIVIEPVDPGVLYVPIYDPYVVYGPWAYPAYRPFYWYPRGYVAAGVIGFGAPFVVGTALWAHYNWESRHVDINVTNYNRFNHANLSAASATWQHDPSHRGNIPYSNPALQTKFGKTGTGTPTPAATMKTNIAPLNPKNGTTTINNNAITNLNKNSGLKVDKNTNLNTHVDTHVNGTNTSNPKAFEHHDAVHTDTHVNTNAVIHNNNAVVHNNPVTTNAVIHNNNAVVHNNPTPVNHAVSGANVVHNAAGGGGNPKDKKKP